MKTTIEDLPIVDIDCIVNYLSARDLMACCGVSKTWRKIFSNDMFWKKLCNTCMSNYLEHAKPVVQCQYAEGHILSTNSSLPLGDWQFKYLKETGVWNNWRKALFNVVDITFDFDDSISYNIKVGFAENDFVFLYSTYQTGVWSTTNDPEEIMTVEFCLEEMWEHFQCSYMKNKLVVVQCNVVQVYNVCLETETSGLNHIFFFDKTEEFCSNLPKEPAGINKVFCETSHSTAEDMECIISGEYLVGVSTHKTDLNHPTLHVWNWYNGKKLKVEPFGDVTCPDEVVTCVTLLASESSKDEILVITEKNKRNKNSSFEVYSLSQQTFKHKIKLDPGHGNLFRQYLIHTHIFKMQVFDLQNPGESRVLYDDQEDIGNVKGCKDLLMVRRSTNIDFFHASNHGLEKLETSLSSDFTLSDFHIVGEKFIILSDLNDFAKEIWEFKISHLPKKNVLLKKIISLPENIGYYRNCNETCTKLVFEYANMLSVLNFW